MLPNDDFKSEQVTGEPLKFSLPEPYKGCWQINGPPGEKRLPLAPRFLAKGEVRVRAVADDWNEEKTRWPLHVCVTGEMEQTAVYGTALVFAPVWPSRNILRWVDW